jgi:hypothetical protein
MSQIQHKKWLAKKQNKRDSASRLSNKARSAILQLKIVRAHYEDVLNNNAQKKTIVG